jgi:hypothetical protein
MHRRKNVDTEIIQGKKQRHKCVLCPRPQDFLAKEMKTCQSQNFGGQLQGCQIFSTQYMYHNEGKYTKLPHHYQMAIKYT